MRLQLDAANRTIRLGAHRGIVRCESGMVWLTISGQWLDVLLETGDEYESTGDGTLVVESYSTRAIVFVEWMKYLGRQSNIGPVERHINSAPTQVPSSPSSISESPFARWHRIAQRYSR